MYTAYRKITGEKSKTKITIVLCSLRYPCFEFSLWETHSFLTMSMDVIFLNIYGNMISLLSFCRYYSLFRLSRQSSLNKV